MSNRATWEDYELESHPRRYDDAVKPWNLEPPILLGREMTEAIFERNDTTPAELFEQAEAIKLGHAEHPARDRKPDALVPTFGMDELDRKAMAKTLKARAKAAEQANTWRET